MYLAPLKRLSVCKYVCHVKTTDQNFMKISLETYLRPVKFPIPLNSGTHLHLIE